MDSEENSRLSVGEDSRFDSRYFLSNIKKDIKSTSFNSLKNRTKDFKNVIVILKSYSKEENVAPQPHTTLSCFN